MTLHDTKTAARHSALNGSLIQRDGGDSIAGICAGSFEEPGLKESHNSLLLIDDNIADVRAFRCALESVRLSVQLTVNFADDIESTVAGLINGTVPLPSLILLGLEMNGGRSLEILRTLKQHPRTRSIPVTVWTRMANECDVAEAYNRHASCVIRKPQNTDQVEAFITRLERFWFCVAALPARSSQGANQNGNSRPKELYRLASAGRGE